MNCTQPRAGVRKVREPGGPLPPPRGPAGRTAANTASPAHRDGSVWRESPEAGALPSPVHWAPTALQGLSFLSRGSGPVVSDRPGLPDACSGKEGVSAHLVGNGRKGWSWRGGQWEEEGDGVSEWGWAVGQFCPWSWSCPPPCLPFPPAPSLTAPSVHRRGHFALVTRRDRGNGVAAEAQVHHQAPPDCTWGGGAGGTSGTGA